MVGAARFELTASCTRITQKYYLTLSTNEVKLNDLEEKWIISFEGIDATGKQTLSGLLQNYFNSLDPDEDEDICTKINIPDYDIPSGQEIKEILINGNYQPEYLQWLPSQSTSESYRPARPP